MPATQTIQVDIQGDPEAMREAVRKTNQAVVPFLEAEARESLLAALVRAAKSGDGDTAVSMASAYRALAA